MPILFGHAQLYNFKNAVFMISDNILILHTLHFITAHFWFISAYLCSDNPLLPKFKAQHGKLAFDYLFILLLSSCMICL